MDDTLLKKNGRKVSGTSWKLDPPGPEFTNNFIRAQRFFQVSPGYRENDDRCRGIPVLFKHCPVPRKPGRHASEEALAEYKIQQKLHRLARAADCIKELRERVAAEDRNIVFIGGGGYSNRTIIDAVIQDHCYIGRIRKNSNIFAVPETPNNGKGRKRYYGQTLPSPDELRPDDSQWREIIASTGNGKHTFKVKSIVPVRSKITGSKDVKILIVQPLRYRPSQKTRLFYRDPAYLICTNPQMDDAKILQYYLWRWEIEVNFKDEKTSFGIHEPQVRTAAAVETAPAFTVLIYALFLLAAKQTSGDGNHFIYPKWRRPKTIWRPSAANYLSAFRAAILTRGINKSGFSTPPRQGTKPLLFGINWQNVICAAVN